jgi:transcriptional regulator with PAS, ATPase and Fis domain
MEGTLPQSRFHWIPVCAAHELRRDFRDLLLASTPTDILADQVLGIVADAPLDVLWSRNPPNRVAELRRRITELRPLAKGGVLAARSGLLQVESELPSTDRLGSAVRALLRGNVMLADRHLLLAFDDRRRPCVGWIGDWLETGPLLERLSRLAEASVPVLVYGETGTGKEMAARGLHVLGPRRDKAYLAINCAELPESIVESELFGHTRGAFTGATSERAGLFEAAADGTVFLDEIGELAPAMQAKLLRLLEEHCVRRIGSAQPRPLACRVVAATNRELATEIARGRFRADLFYRLRGSEVRLAPLRERREDILLLAELFLARAVLRSRKGAVELGEDAKVVLLSHHWPGNIRELRHAIDMAFLAAGSRYVEAHHLGLAPLLSPDSSSAEPLLTAQAVERAHILRTLASTAGNRMAAARILGLSRQSLQRRLLRHGIEVGTTIGHTRAPATPENDADVNSKTALPKQIP